MAHVRDQWYRASASGSGRARTARYGVGRRWLSRASWRRPVWPAHIAAATTTVARVAKAAGISRRTSPHSLRHTAITNALDAGVPLRDAQIVPRHADPRTTEHYDPARGSLDRHGVHFLTAHVAGV